MPRFTLLFVHGWGFDGSIWTGLRRQLGEFASAAVDLGYFGTPQNPRPQGPVVAIGHSLGSLLLLRKPPLDCRALIAINGFDRFTASSGCAGVDPRVIGRMVSRFESAPDQVLDEFRNRCGADESPQASNTRLLDQHLRLLGEADERGRSANWTRPMLTLQADDDPILPPELRADAFAAAASRRQHTRPDGGHLLPVTQPGWCAEQIRKFLSEAA